MHQQTSTRRALFFLLLGPSVAVAVALAGAWAGLSPAAWKTMAIATLCVVWWLTEPISLAATAIVPFALLPMTGVMDHRAVSSAYGSSLVLLLLGGFMLSRLLEDSGAHRRLAMGMIRLVGGHSHRRLVLAFMLAAAALSMWLAHTAVVLMMLPIVAAIYESDEYAHLAAPLLLGICYAANIGGMGSPIGTPPNVVFMATYQEVTGESVSFLDWMKLGIPAVLILMPIAWLIVTRELSKGAPVVLEARGPWSQREVRAVLLFALTALAWVTREGPAGGWTELLGLVDHDGKALVGDSTVGLFFVVLAFLIPDGQGGPLLSWQAAARIPWGLLVLLGGGIALAQAFAASGLSAGMGRSLAGAAGWPIALTIMVICVSVGFMTELATNTAIATLLMPVMAAAAVGVGQNPAMLMLPAVLCLSCDFMLPVGTGSNTIVYGTGRIPIARMVRAGLLLKVVAILVIWILCVNVLPHILSR
jgi:sodium-dependent dicarboxylate transporter 2/3/5